MPLRPPIFQVLAWRLRAWRMRWCRTSAQLVSACGLPSRRLVVGHASVWQYPLQIFGGHLHSIYVAMVHEQPIGADYRVEPFVPKAPDQVEATQAGEAGDAAPADTTPSPGAGAGSTGDAPVPGAGRSPAPPAPQPPAAGPERRRAPDIVILDGDEDDDFDFIAVDNRP